MQDKGLYSIKCVEDDKLLPYQYPVTKAYEMMSFFEALLDYYDVTGEERYLKIFTSFIEKVRDSEITVIGCAGCTDELFDHSYIAQTKKAKTYMQETCVTVTWMRLLNKYYRITKCEWCLDELEKSFVNDILGMINDKGNRGYSYFDKEYVEVLPFDSYSPLYCAKRGVAVGGFKDLPGGGHYGCCCAIASSGIGAFVKNIIEKVNDEYFLRFLFPIEADDGAKIKVEGSYLYDDKVIVTVSGKPINISVRLPQKCRVLVNGERTETVDRYVLLKGFIGKIEIYPEYEVEQIVINGKICYKIGPMVLAQDEHVASIKSVALKIDSIKTIKDKNCFKHVLINGIDFIDYAHAGKVWDEKIITVWNKTEGATYAKDQI